MLVPWGPSSISAMAEIVKSILSLCSMVLTLFQNNFCDLHSRRKDQQYRQSVRSQKKILDSISILPKYLNTKTL